jgi:hypothetical protein
MRKPHFLTVLLVGLFAARESRADACFVPNWDNNPVVRLENLESFSDYDFYLLYGHSTGNPGARLLLTPVGRDGRTRVEGNGWRFTKTYLIGVPKGQPAPHPPLPDGDPDAWMSRSGNGILQSNALEGFTGNGAPEGFVMPYRVELGAGKLQVIALPLELAPADWLGSHLCLAIAGVAMSVSIAWFVLMILRRKKQAA